MVKLVRALGTLACLAATIASADPIRVRYPEGASHGYLALSDTSGKTLAHGELTQWPERGAMANRLLLRFADGSIYDETTRFSQQRVFRLLAYHLVQHGPSFKTALDVQFDRSGRYRARHKAAPNEDEETASGSVDVPEDCSNGLTSLLLKNLPSGGTATTHLLAFTPKPQLLDVHLTPEGSDRFWLGSTARSATRYRIEPKVPGVKGMVAKAIGKDPPVVHMWMGEGRPPTFVLFEGSLELDGAIWRIELATPGWKR